MKAHVLILIIFFTTLGCIRKLSFPEMAFHGDWQVTAILLKNDTICYEGVSSTFGELSFTADSVAYSFGLDTILFEGKETWTFDKDNLDRIVELGQLDIGSIFRFEVEGYRRVALDTDVIRLHLVSDFTNRPDLFINICIEKL